MATNPFNPSQEDPWANLRKTGADVVEAEKQAQKEKAETEELVAKDDRPLWLFKTASTTSSHGAQNVLDEAEQAGYTHVEALEFHSPWYSFVFRRDT